MYLGIDFIPTKNGLYILEANLGIPGGLSDIIEGTMNAGFFLKRKFGKRKSSLWLKSAAELFSNVETLSMHNYGVSFSTFARNNQIMKDLKISKESRRRCKPIPKNLNGWVYFADKSYFFEFLKDKSLKYMKTPETYIANNKSELLKFGKIVLDKKKNVIIKPPRLWHGLGVAKIENVKELICFKSSYGYPMVVQEYISSDYLQEHFDMRVIIMCGRLVAVLIRVANKNSAISNISAGGKVVLCFPSDNKKGFIFKSVLPKTYRRYYYTEWEKILLEDYATFYEKKYTDYDKRVCLIGVEDWNLLNNFSKEIYRLMSGHCNKKL